MAKLKNLLFQKSPVAFQLENQSKRDEKGTYYISYKEFIKLQAKIRALFYFVILFFIIIAIIIFVVFPQRFNQV